MIESFLIAVNVVIPLFVFMGIGVILKSKGVVSEVTLKEMNDVVFKVLLSTMVFYNIYQADFRQDFDGKILCYAIVSLVCMILLLIMIVPRCIRNRRVAPVMIQGIYRSNFVLFGLQVTASICGSDRLGMATILISVIIPLYNVIAVILFETYRSGKINMSGLIKGILKNPLILASVLGLLVLFSGFRFPSMVENLLKTISGMATPMSLILLGGTITVKGIKQYWKYTLIASLGRLIIVPALFLSVAFMLGFRGVGLVALMVMYASPTAVSSFPMASQMGGDGELAGQIVAVTTIFSVVTIFFWTYLLSFIGAI